MSEKTNLEKLKEMNADELAGFISLAPYADICQYCEHWCKPDKDSMISCTLSGERCKAAHRYRALKNWMKQKADD